MEGGPRIDLKKSINALSKSQVEPQVDEVLAFVSGALPCSDPCSVRVLLCDERSSEPVAVLKLTANESKNRVQIESSTLSDEECARLEKRLRQCSATTLLELFFEASLWVEERFNEPSDHRFEEVEESADESSDVADLTDSRTGIVVHRPIPSVYKNRLAGMCAKVLGDNLLRFEGFEQAPVSVRGRVFVYLVRSGTISSKKLAMLVGPDVLVLNFDGPSTELVHMAYVPSIIACTNLTKLKLAGCKSLDAAAWATLASRLKHLEDLDASDTLVHDLFLQTVAPCLKVARFANCERVNGGIQSLVERSNKLVELDISGCENIPYLICANLLGSFWPCFVTLRAARCGDMRGTVRSNHHSACKCTFCCARSELRIAESLNGARCHGVSYDLSDCKWISSQVFPPDCVFPFLRNVKFGRSLLLFDVYDFCTRCPMLENLDWYLAAPDRFSSKLEQSKAQQFDAAIWNGSNLPSRRISEVAIAMSLSWKPYTLSVMLKPLAESLTDLTLASLKCVDVNSAMELATYFPKLNKLHLQQLFWKKLERSWYSPKSPKLSSLKIIALTEGTPLSLSRILETFAVKSVVLRGLRDMVTLEVLASLKEVKSLSIDIESGIVHPLSWIDADTLTSLSVFGFALHALSSETGKLKVMPNVSSLDISRPFCTGDDAERQKVERSTYVFNELFLAFPSLKVLKCKHQFPFLITAQVPLNVKSIVVCRSDHIGVGRLGVISRATCELCEKREEKLSQQEDFLLSLFD